MTLNIARNSFQHFYLACHNIFLCIFRTFPEVSCEDNNAEELKTIHKASKYDPEKDLLEKVGTVSVLLMSVYIYQTSSISGLFNVYICLVSYAFFFFEIAA